MNKDAQSLLFEAASELKAASPAGPFEIGMAITSAVTALCLALEDIRAQLAVSDKKIEVTNRDGNKILLSSDTIQSVKPSIMVVDTDVVPDCKKSFPEADAGVHDGSVISFKRDVDNVLALETVEEIKGLING